MKAVKVIVLLALLCGMSYFVYMKTTVLKGSGNVVTVTRDMGDFNGVHLEGAARMTITQSDTPLVQLEAEDNVLPEITTVVEGGVLRISTGKGMMSVSPSEPINITLALPEIRHLECSGDASVNVSAVKADRLDIAGNGSWEFKVGSLEVDALTVNLKGGGTCELLGKAATQNVEISGRGKYDAPRLQSRDASISVGGGARAAVWVKDTLNVKITGSGKVEYYGKPKVTEDIEDSRLGIVRSLGTH